MDEQCKQYQLLLMDIHFGERNMDGEIKGHLEKCNDCQAYWQGLDKIEETLDALNFEPAVDYPQISEVLARVRKRESILESLKFVLVAICLLLASVLTGFKFFLFLQAFFYLTLPFLSLPLIYHYKERCDSRG